MPREIEQCEIVLWTIKRLMDACQEISHSTEKITIPTYQRRLVWDREKQKDLIRSIKSGYPFGSLLLFADKVEDGKQIFHLIDGLQRTNAILEYVKDPNQFFHSEDVNSELVDLVTEELNVTGTDVSEKVRKTLSSWVRSRKGFSEIDGWSIDELATSLVSELLLSDDTSVEFRNAYFELLNNGILSTQLKHFLTDVRNEADIGKATLPVILYKGESGNLPEIFSLLNSTGVALSPYEVFAASWTRFKCKIQKDQIREAIRKKYEALVDNGFTSEAFENEEEEHSGVGRDYSLFEFLFGFGQHLSESYPYLFSPVDADTPSSIGFNLVTACIGMRLSEMHLLESEILDRKIRINELCDRIFESVDAVDESLKPILSVNHKGRKSNPVIFHAELQIISLIASVFQAKYDLRTLEKKRNWQKSQKELTRRLPMFFLNDIVREHWRGSGDSKLYEDVTSMRFSKRMPSVGQWKAILDLWFDEKQITMLHKKRSVRKASTQILFLKYIYVKRISVFQNTQEFHVEHIVPVNRLTSRMATTSEGLPINCVSNLALLEQEQNQRKGSSTFLEYWNRQFERGAISQDELEENLRKDEEMLLCPVTILPSAVDSLDRDQFNEFLWKRFCLLREEFLRLWSELIPNS